MRSRSDGGKTARTALAVLVALAAMASLAVTSAWADMLWEPYENSFYDKHGDECVVVGRSYLTNGAEGYVTMVEAPNSNLEVTNIANGESFYVQYTWNGQWALGEWGTESDGCHVNDWEGWIDLDDLSLLYDNTAFQEDHSSEFQEYDGSGDELTEVCLYTYPGGRYGWTLEEERNYKSFAETFQYLYTDENGLRWTYVGYYMGKHNAWACVDDPLNENLGTAELLTAAQVRGEDESITPAAETVPAARTWVVWLVPAGLVVAVVVVTAVVLRKRRGQKPV